MVTSATSSGVVTDTQAASAAGAATAQAAQPGGALGQDEFMKLLIAQLQNQDPTQPMDGTAMASQLAQFSSLSQLQAINTTLQDQSTAAGSLLGAVQATSAVSMIGHTVIASGNSVELGGANGATSVTANIGSAGATATLSILDANGKVVGSRDLGAVSAGKQTFDIGDAGKDLPPGDYTYSIDVKDSAGAEVTVTPYMSGKVTGVSTSQNGLLLDVGGIEIPYGNVIQITS